MNKQLFAAGMLFVCTALASSSSFAQDPTPAPPSPSPGASPPTVAPPISEEAKRHFSAGVSFLQDPEGEKVEEAYRQFKTAYDLSSSAKILGNMGFCAMRLERDGEAIDAYSKYLREVPDIDPEERAQIVRDLQMLQVGVARISVQIDPPTAGAILIDERVPVRGSKVTNAYGPVTTGKLDIGIRPGHHIFTAKLSGREEASWEVEAYAGSKDQHSFVLKEVRAASGGPTTPAEEKPSMTGPIILTAVGGAMLVGGGITGVIALGKTSDISDKCPNDLCPASYDLDKDRSSARTLVGVTDLLLLVGTVTVLGGLYWMYRTSSSEPAKKPAVLPTNPTTTRASAARGFWADWRLAL